MEFQFSRLSWVSTNFVYQAEFATGWSGKNSILKLKRMRMDQSFGAWTFGCNNKVADIQRPRIARFHCKHIIFVCFSISQFTLACMLLVKWDWYWEVNSCITNGCLANRVSCVGFSINSVSISRWGYRLGVGWSFGYFCGIFKIVYYCEDLPSSSTSTSHGNHCL